mgnify:FL=1
MTPKGHQLQLDILGEPFVYPGHAVTIALLIIHAFPSLEAAEAKGDNFPAALEASLIPGAGGNVYSALTLLRRMRDGMTWHEAIENADGGWKSCDDHYGSERWKRGQAQADRMKPYLHDRVGAWLGIKGPLPA